MKFRKSVFMLMVGLLVMTGCTKEPEPKREPVIIDVYDSVSGHRGLQTGWYAKILEEKFNIQLNFLNTSREDSLKNADLYVCSKEDVGADVLLGRGMLLDMEPYLKEAPLRDSELVDYKESYEYWNEQLGLEGIYVMPTRVSRLSQMTPSEENTPGYGVYLNWELYESVDMPDIRDRGELLSVLQSMQEQGEADGRQCRGLILYEDQETDLLDHISNLMGVWGGRREGFLINVEGRYEELLHKDSLYLEVLEWLREAYHRGLVEEASGAVNRQQVEALYLEGKVLLSIWPGLGTEGYALAPIEDMTVVSNGCDPLGRVDTYVGINAQAEDPERVLELVSWLYSTEGIMISGTDTPLKAAGPQELTWKVESGNPVLTEFGQQVLAESREEISVPQEWGGGNWQQGSCKLSLQPVVSVEVCPSGFPYNYTLWDTTMSRYTRSEPSWQERMKALEPMEYLIRNGKLTVLPPYLETERYAHETQEMEEKRQACREVITEYSRRILKAEDQEESQRLLEEMRTKARLAGYEDVVEYDRHACRQ